MGSPCRLASGAIISLCLVSKQLFAGVSSPLEELASWMLYLAGIQVLGLPQSTALWHKAFARCQQLTEIDLSQVSIVHTQVFSIVALAQTFLPSTLPTALKLSKPVFRCAQLHSHSNCAALDHRAFAGCGKLVCLTCRSEASQRSLVQIGVTDDTTNQLAELMPRALKNAKHCDNSTCSHGLTRCLPE